MMVINQLNYNWGTGGGVVTGESTESLGYFPGCKWDNVDL